MGEHLLTNPEHHRPENREQRAESIAEEDSEQRAKSKEQSSDNSVDSLRQKISEHAAKASEIRVDDASKTDVNQPLFLNRELKAEALRRTLNRTRKHLSKPQQVLSKAIHQPAIDAISQVGEKTIARPTGLLTGSIIALGGSSYLLYTAKHFGYEYNYLAVVILFAGGYLAGLIIELLVHFTHHKK